MKLNGMLLRLESVIAHWWRKRLERIKRKCEIVDPMIEQVIAAEMASTYEMRSGIASCWYGDSFYIAGSVTAENAILGAGNVCSSPRFSCVSKRSLLKIPNLNDIKMLRHFWFVPLAGYGSIISWGPISTLVNYYFSANYNIDKTTDMPLMLACELLLLFAFIIDLATLSQLIPVPYIIFDHDIKSLVLCGKGPNETIPFNRISFHVLQIEDSPAYCALEMHIAHTDKPPQKMITDICDSHPQAQSILNTYLSILSGDEAIYHQKLKSHPAMLSEFNMPWYKGILHFWRITTDWFSCIFPHYIAFRWVHGHPMGVLKKYIIEQQLKQPIQISPIDIPHTTSVH